MTQPGTGWQMPSLISPDAALARAAEHLADQYKGVFSRETVLRYLDDSYTLLAATATITGHLPSLAIRFATDRLAAVARNQGTLTAGVPEVLLMGCGDACPVYAGTRYLDWDLPDPSGLPLSQVRPIRDEIDHRVRQLLVTLTAPKEQTAR